MSVNHRSLSIQFQHAFLFPPLQAADQKPKGECHDQVPYNPLIILISFSKTTFTILIYINHDWLTHTDLLKHTHELFMHYTHTHHLVFLYTDGLTHRLHMRAQLCRLIRFLRCTHTAAQVHSVTMMRSDAQCAHSTRQWSERAPRQHWVRCW